MTLQIIPKIIEKSLVDQLDIWYQIKFSEYLSLSGDLFLANIIFAYLLFCSVENITKYQ